MTDKTRSKILHGKPASTGIAIGQVWILEDKTGTVRPDKIADEEIERHLEKLERGLRLQQDHYLDLKEKADDEEVEAILDAQVQTLRDPELNRKIEGKISDDHYGVEYAIFSTFNEYIQLLEDAQAQWAKDRTIDIVSIRDQLIDATQEKKKEYLIDEGAVIFANEISPTVMIQLSQLNVSGIVMQKGGATSHAVILSQSLGIPCVIGVPWSRLNLKKGTEVIVDGDSGQLILAPSGKEVLGFQKRKEEQRVQIEKALKWAQRPDTTSCGASFTLRANVEFLEELPRISTHGARGVGLLRTETILFGVSEFDVSDQVRFYRQVLEASGEHTVTIRLFDAGGDKLLDNVETEANPFLGWRGIRMLLDETGLLKRQLEAIYRVSEYFEGKLRILIPMVSGMHEIRQIHKLCGEVCDTLRKDRVGFDRNIPIGIMVEVPSVALMADTIAGHVDFFSIGTNDLTQYTLAVDRGNEKISQLYEPIHPSIWKLIRMTTEGAEKHGIPVSVCGEMASQPMAAACLLGMGINDLSMNSGSIPKVKSLLCSHSLVEMKDLSEAVLNAEDSQDVYEIFENFGRKIAS